MRTTRARGARRREPGQRMSRCRGGSCGPSVRRPVSREGATRRLRLELGKLLRRERDEVDPDLTRRGFRRLADIHTDVVPRRAAQRVCGAPHAQGQASVEWEEEAPEFE